ncbi:MAG: HAMP domain-containing protein, partial [Elusimicrobiota bacterium]
MKKSIFFKILGGYFFILVLSVILIIIFSFNTIRDNYISTLSNNLKNIGKTLKLKIKQPLINERYKDLDKLVKELGEEINTRITIISPTGVVYADSEKDPQTMENHSTRPEIRQAFKGEIGQSIRFSTTVRERMLYVAMPVKENGKIISVLRMSLFLEDIRTLLGKLKSELITVSVFILIILLTGAAVFSKSLARPIDKLAQGARRVASGDFDVNIILKKNDELRELAESFNYMTEEIKKLFKNLSLQKEELNGILSSIQGCII